MRRLSRNASSFLLQSKITKYLFQFVSGASSTGTEASAVTVTFLTSASSTLHVATSDGGTG